MTNLYCSSVAWTAVTAYANLTSYVVGNLVRQLAAPTVGNERVFRCTTLGVSGASEPTWTLTAGGTTSAGTATFTEVTGTESLQSTSWAAPFARLQTAASRVNASGGDTIFVSADHAETQAAAMTVSWPAIITPFTNVYCVARPSTSIPPAAADLATGATVTVTGSFSLTMSGCVYMYGVEFDIASGAAGTQNLTLGASSTTSTYEQCKFKSNSTSGSSVILLNGPIGGGGSPVSGVAYTYKNCTFGFGAAGATLAYGHPTLLDGGSLTGTAPTVLFNSSGIVSGPIDIRNMDLSLLAGASNIFSLTNMNLPYTCANISCCKVNAALAAITTGTLPKIFDGNVDVSVTDSAGVSREEHYRFTGSVISDTANYLTAGASNGVTHLSWKCVSNANATVPAMPLELPEITAYLAAGTHILTLYCANTSSVTLKNIDFGFDVEYLADAGDPLGAIATSFPALYSAGTSLTTNAVSWTGLASPVKQQATVTITQGRAGWVRVKPKLFCASTTLWVDPLLAVS